MVHHHGDDNYLPGGGSQSKNMANSQQHQSSFEVWNNFFHSAGIPSIVSQDYAMKFSQHRIRIDMLQEISKDILLDMGIKAMGDIIAILRHAKSICTQNELKPSGIEKTMGSSNHLMAPSVANSNQNPSTPKSLSQRMPITTNQSSLRLAAAVCVGTVENKMQSRLNPKSGAVIASSNNNGFGDNKRASSSISSSLAKRLAPATIERRPNLDLAEKTLTVHYPSSAAIAKAAQRIAGPDAHTNNHQRVAPTSSSIKSRLGSVISSGGGKFESNSGSTIRLTSNSHISKQSHRSSSSSVRPTNRYSVPTGRRFESRHSDHDRNSRDDSSNDRHPSTRLKSTVFSRLGQSAR